ncbi:hypothetical protein PIB30_029188 [Stylosanthes scabra]|uniref:Uncharacterized protein n=1 Tax=Stylosanthes scabra TaxID=79078 RepID=A0ABU6QAL7_9FABA|nr:hypothetical protein [Stylosanthes scabra]
MAKAQPQKGKKGKKKKALSTFERRKGIKAIQGTKLQEKKGQQEEARRLFGKLKGLKRILHRNKGADAYLAFPKLNKFIHYLAKSHLDQVLNLAKRDSRNSLKATFLLTQSIKGNVWCHLSQAQTWLTKTLIKAPHKPTKSRLAPSPPWAKRESTEARQVTFWPSQSVTQMGPKRDYKLHALLKLLSCLVRATLNVIHLSQAKPILTQRQGHVLDQFHHYHEWLDFSKARDEGSVHPKHKSVNLRENDNSTHLYYLIRSGVLAGGSLGVRKDFGYQGKDKHTLEFDYEIERTLRKLRKQTKLQKQTQENSSEEVFEEVCDNMAAEGNQRRTF